MTSEGLGEIFEGDSASVDGGLSGGSSMRRPGSEDPKNDPRTAILSWIILWYGWLDQVEVTSCCPCSDHTHNILAGTRSEC